MRNGPPLKIDHIVIGRPDLRDRRITVKREVCRGSRVWSDKNCLSRASTMLGASSRFTTMSGTHATHRWRAQEPPRPAPARARRSLGPPRGTSWRARHPRVARQQFCCRFCCRRNGRSRGLRGFAVSPRSPAIPVTFQAFRLERPQGRQDSNLRPSVLETDALPAELRPSTATLQPPHGSEVGGAGQQQRPPVSATRRPSGSAASRPSSSSATSTRASSAPSRPRRMRQRVRRRGLGAQRAPRTAGRAARHDRRRVGKRARAHASRRREAERVQHVLERRDGRGTGAQQRVDALTERRPGRPGHREHLAPERERVVGGDQRARAPRRLDHDRARSRAPRSDGSAPESATAPARRPRPTRRRSRRPRRSGRRARCSGAGRRDRCRSRAPRRCGRRRERSGVRRRVDAEREPGDDGDARAPRDRATARTRTPRPACCRAARRRPRPPARRTARRACARRARTASRGARRRELIEHGRPLGSSRRAPRGSSDDAAAGMEGERLGEIVVRDPLALGEVGDRARHAERAHLCAAAETEPGCGALEQVARLRLDADAARVVSSGCRAFGAALLALAPAAVRATTTRARTSAVCSGRSRRMSDGIGGRDADDEIDPVEQRAREPCAVALELLAASTRTRGRRRTGRGSSLRRAARRLGSVRGPRPWTTITSPSSSGWRSASSATRENSPSSSRKSTPRCARVSSPGCGPGPPPTSAADEAPWCGARNGGRRTRPLPGSKPPTAEWIRVTSSASLSIRSGSRPGSRRASIVFPAPGGPTSRRA